MFRHVSGVKNSKFATQKTDILEQSRLHISFIVYFTSLYNEPLHDIKTEGDDMGYQLKLVIADETAQKKSN